MEDIYNKLVEHIRLDVDISLHLWNAVEIRRRFKFPECIQSLFDSRIYIAMHTHSEFVLYILNFGTKVGYDSTNGMYEYRMHDPYKNS